MPLESAFELGRIDNIRSALELAVSKNKILGEEI